MTTFLTPAQQAEAVAGVEAMAWHIARRLRAKYPQADLDDIAAEVRVGFLKAARFFDPALGWKFTTYASKCGWQAGVRFCQRWSAGGIRYGDGAVGVVAVDFLADVTDGRPDVPRRAFPPDLWDRIADTLKGRVATVILLRFRDGLTLRQVGERFRITKERIRQLQNRGLRQLREACPEFEDLLAA
jgi:DNA-directed RNA polymerase specialized sigma subunit